MSRIGRFLILLFLDSVYAPVTNHFQHPTSHSECDDTSTNTNCLLQRINDLSKRVSAMEASPGYTCPTVAFGAYFNAIPNVRANTQLVFDNVQLNMGAAYKPFHGNFIAPVNGMYLFTYTITSNPYNWIRITIVKNGRDVGQLLHTDLEYHQKTTETIILQLNKGDDVWLEVRDIIGTIKVERGMQSHYFGIILRCLD